MKVVVWLMENGEIKWEGFVYVFKEVVWVMLFCIYLFMSGIYEVFNSENV